MSDKKEPRATPVPTARVPYEAPAVVGSTLFETLAMSCVKFGVPTRTQDCSFGPTNAS